MDLVPEFPSLQPGARSDKELKLQSLGISVTSTTPALTQLDGICVVKNTVLTFSIPGVAAESSLTLDWEIRQLQRNGSLGEWVSVGQGNPFDYTAEDPGIYQLRAQIDIGSAVVESVWSRQNDENGGADSHGTFNEMYRMGEPDFFGVATAPVQLEIRKQARLNLNSTAYALAASLNLFIGGPTYSSTQNKCNAFVYHKASDAGAPVPLINGFPLEYPPTAYDWWDGFTEIDGWTRLNGYHWMEDYRPPEPGFVVAGPDESAHPYFARYGHVGILDYDGGWIQAGSVTVNKNPHLISHQLAPYQPAGFREYRGQQ